MSKLRLLQVSRSGVTLLEVLIGLFVVAVGLLGLAALIPIGRWQMEEATRIDRGSTLGRAAFRDLTVRSHLRMENWLYCSADSSSGPLPVLDSATSGFRSPPYGSGNNPTMTPPLAPMVLDPLMIAYNSGSSSTLQMVQVFPYELPNTPTTSAIEWANAPKLARTTLVNPRNKNSQASGGAAFSWLLPLSAADTYFRGDDDVPFQISPEDRRLKPHKPFAEAISTSSNTPIPAAGQAQGDFSWFAVVAPDRYETEGRGGLIVATQSLTPVLQSSLGSARTTRQFTASVVVCHKRTMQNLAGATYQTRDRERGERRARLDFISSARFSTGSSDAWLTMSDLRGRDEADRATYLRGGEWLMAMAYVPMPGDPFASSGSSARMMTDVQFFRVLSVGRQLYQDSNSPNVWKRRVRLTGSAWTIPASNNTSGASSLAPAYAVIVDGAIGVYRKSLVSDGASLWSQ